MSKKYRTRAAVIATVANDGCRLLALGMQHGHHIRLVQLSKGIGQLAGSLSCLRQGPDILVRIASFAAGWAEQISGGPHKGDILSRIDQERDRQERLFQAGKHLFTCASKVADPQRKFGVLMEEIGEVAKAIQCFESVEASCENSVRVLEKALAHLTTELIQVAAVAVAWLESLEVQS